MSVERDSGPEGEAEGVDGVDVLSAVVADDAGVDADGEIDGKRLLVRMGWGLLGLVVVVGILGATLREPLVALSESFVKMLGGPGIAAGLFLADGFMMPLPHEAFTAFGVIGGMAFWTVVGWGSLGSLLGGVVGYNVGRRLASTRLVWKMLNSKQGQRVRAMVQRHGDLAVAIGAVTPLPYSIVGWTCGAMEVPFGRYMLVSLLRVPRIAFYLWLIQLGFVSAPS